MTREALLAFTQRLVERYAPEKVILLGSLARGEARWDSDADVLVVMPFEGRHLAKIREMRRLCPVRFPLDLLVRRPEEIGLRYRGVIRSFVMRSTMGKFSMVEPWQSVKFLRNGRILLQRSHERDFQARQVILDRIPENQLIHGFVHMDDSVPCSNDAAYIGNDHEHTGIGFKCPLESLYDDSKFALHS